jgi:OOP family OmpA-OmpF porin
MTNCFNLKLTGAAVALALAGIAGSAAAATPGYVSSSSGQVWTSPYGMCWRTTDWTPEKAAAPCDVVPVAQVAPPPVAVAPPPPVAAAPTPPPPPVIEQISLSNDVLFEFDKAQLKPDGMKTLDEISNRLKGANVAAISLVGHADRIGEKDYNQELSERRAAAVKEYLAQKGVEGTKVRAEGRGEAEPTTGDQCKNLRGDKLIQCLQPDRRVDIEVRGERQVAGTPPSPTGGGTSGSGTLGTPGGASSGAAPTTSPGTGGTSGSPSSGGTK